ncbi:MAG TPA: hypothetical protein PLY36_01165 [Spirochaetota bacterium]|nr:hypothetical protein [Spirochaetota bacterium]
MPDSDKFDFDPLLDDDIPDSGNDLFQFEDEPGSKKESLPDDSFDDDITPDEEIIEPEPDFSVQKRSSADFSPDMDALLLTAQSSMIIEAMKLISLHDFKSKNISIFSEAIKGIDLYMKILERNPENFKKLAAILSSDQDCMDVQKITFNLFRNVMGELPESDSQKLKAFGLINDKLKNAYNKSLISSSIVSVKKYYLLSGSLDTMKIENDLINDPAGLKNQINCFIRHINIGRQMIKSGNSEIVKGMKGKELNVFIVKAAQMLVYYFRRTGDTELQMFYTKLHENFKKYFIVR